MQSLKNGLKRTKLYCVHNLPGLKCVYIFQGPNYLFSPFFFFSCLLTVISEMLAFNECCDEQNESPGGTDTIPTPDFLIDQESDSDATVVEIMFGDRLAAFLDTVSHPLRICEESWFCYAVILFHQCMFLNF